MKIPDRIISEVADRLDMADVVSEYVSLQKKGGRYWGLCPFHSEKTPSFTVTPEKSVFYCFGCQKGGSIFTFIMDMEKFSFVEAVRHLARKAGVDFNFESGDSERDTQRREAYLELYRKVAGSFHHLLLNHKQAAGARKYLMDRGISQDTIGRFRLGYAPTDREWLFGFLREKNYSEVFLRISGLFSERRGSLIPMFRDRIVFPISNSRDEVIAFGGRSLREDSRPKYLNSPETFVFRKGENLFGPPGMFKAIRGLDEFILVEGYMDVLALFLAGKENCAAPLGTSLTSLQLRLLKRYAGKGILLFDGDEAGVKATWKAAVLCEQQGLTAAVVELSEGEDPAEIIEKEGPERLHNKLKYPINSFQFLIGKALLKYDFHTPDGKEGIFRLLDPYLEAVDSEVKRDGYLRVLAEALEVDFDSVRNDFVKGIKSLKRNTSVREGIMESSEVSADRFLMLAIVSNRDYFPRLRNTVAVDDIEDSRARALYIALEECFRSQENSLEALFACIDDRDLNELILRKISSEEFNINQDQLIEDGIKRIKQRSLEKKQHRLISLLSRKSQEGGDPAGLKDLLAEKMYLDEELQNLKVMPNDRPAE